MNDTRNSLFIFDVFNFEPIMEQFQNMTGVPIIDIGSPPTGYGFIECDLFHRDNLPHFVNFHYRRKSSRWNNRMARCYTWQKNGTFAKYSPARRFARQSDIRTRVS